MTATTEIVLGTAQLTSAYGIANRRGAATGDQAIALLRAAEAFGLTALDTAPVYGDAESIIGEAVVRLAVFTKASGPDVEASVQGSLERLGRSAIDVLFFHDPDVVLSDRGLVDRAAALVGGPVRTLGASVYTQRQFEAALADPRLSCIQAPLSAADRRLVDRGLLSDAQRRGVKVYARSVFLQGALLLEPDSLPQHLSPLAPLVTTIRKSAADVGRTVEQLLLQYAASMPGVTGVVVGCETADQMANDVEALREGSLDRGLAAALAELPAIAENIVDPRTWPVATTGTAGGAR